MRPHVLPKKKKKCKQLENQLKQANQSATYPLVSLIRKKVSTHSRALITIHCSICRKPIFTGISTTTS